MIKTITFLRAAAVGLLALFLCMTPSQADIPDELYTALGVTRDSSPKELYEALTKRYYDPEQGFGKGSLSEFWEPIPISKYLNPGVFYEPPDMDFEATRAECVECHTSVTPGWVHSWEDSVHSRLDEIRNLPAEDVRAYKKEIIEQVEANLRSMEILPADKSLAEVSCIDCHMGPTVEKGNHKTDLRMPDAAACGQCHLQQFAERESERDTANWPQDQWPAGRPSHALDMKANVETAVWAAMEQRDIAEGCTFCHINQARCDGCHTRHEFSVVEARKPQACATCHNGVDHNEFENYMFSKHGTIYQTRGDTWNWEARLADSMEKGGQIAPTCQTCHMEYQGEFGHNVVRKVRWGFNPTPNIADNLDHEWFQNRRDAWLQTCQTCHSGRFAEAYLDGVDRGTKDGIKLEQEAKQIVQALYDDGLLVGQQTNRPAPPKPEVDAPGTFFQLFWAKGNNPSVIEYEYNELWEHHLIKLYKGLAHANPGGYTYSEGWSQIIKSYTRIQDENTRIREMADLKQKVAALSPKKQGKLFELNTPVQRASVGILGSVLLLLGGVVFLRSRRSGDAR